MIKKYSPEEIEEQVHQLLLSYNKDGATSSFDVNYSGKEMGAAVIEAVTKDADDLTHIQSENFFLDVANLTNDKHVIFNESIGRFKRPKILIFFNDNEAVDEIGIKEASKYLCKIEVIKHSKNGRMN